MKQLEILHQPKRNARYPWRLVDYAARPMAELGIYASQAEAITAKAEEEKKGGMVLLNVTFEDAQMIVRIFDWFVAKSYGIGVIPDKLPIHQRPAVDRLHMELKALIGQK